MYIKRLFSRDIGSRDDTPGLHRARVVFSRSILGMCKHWLLLLGAAYWQIAQFSWGVGALVNVKWCCLLKRWQSTDDAEERTKTTLPIRHTMWCGLNNTILKSRSFLDCVTIRSFNVIVNMDNLSSKTGNCLGCTHIMHIKFHFLGYNVAQNLRLF